MILANALDHIAKSAAKSRSQTRRLRWIQRRAEDALAGKEFQQIDIELPKSAGPDTPEKLAKRMAFHIAIKHQLAEALRQALSIVDPEKLPPHINYQELLRLSNEA